MKKKLYFLLMGLVIVALSQTLSAQSVWAKYITLKKSFTGGNGDVYKMVRNMDSRGSTLFLNGYWDRAMIYDNQGNTVITNVFDSNTLKLSNGTWTSGGKISFGDRLSAVNGHDTLNGLDYLAVEQLDSHGLMMTNFKVRNTTTNRYEPVPNFQFNGGLEGAHFLDNGKAYVYGAFYEGKDKFGTKICSGEAMVDVSAGTLSQVPSPYYYDSYNGGKAESALDKTFIVYGGARLRILYPTSTTFEPYPPIPVGAGMVVAVAVKDRNKIYVILQRDSTSFPCYLYELVGNSWQNMGFKFTTNNPPTFRSQNRISSMEYSNGKLYLAGNHDLLNGQPVSHILLYDIATGTFSNLPNQPFLSMEASTIKMVNGKLYLLEDNSSIVFGEQSVYILRDATTAVPVITGPTTPQSSTVAIVGTVSVPSLSIDIYNSSTSVLLGTAQASTSGQWSLTLIDQLPGTYTVYAKGRNAEGYVSASSATWTYTVSTTTAVSTLSLDPDASSVFPNPIRDWATLKNVKRVSGVYSYDGRRCTRVQVSRQTIDLSALPPGMYLIKVVNKKNRQEVIRVVKL
jgi:hypothetical protein